MIRWKVVAIRAAIALGTLVALAASAGAGARWD